jgi:Polyketide cyclase / dehydrase and lipid transport
MKTNLRTLDALTLALCLAVSGALAQTPARTEAADDSDIVVSAEKDGENIIIDVEMRVRAPLSVVWEVFTDYDHMTRFVSSVNSSRIVERSGNTVHVAQQSNTELGMLKFSFDNVRQVELVPYTEIRSRLISGDMKGSAFATRLMGDPDGTVRIYNHGVFIPTMWVPPVVGTAFLESQTRKQFFELRNEILRRAAATKAMNPAAQSLGK